MVAGEASNLAARGSLTNVVAQGDGVADDGPALARALAGCDAWHALYLPPGDYRTRQQLKMPAGCHLRGDWNFTYLIFAAEKPNTVISADNSAGAFTSGGAVLTIGDGSTLEGIAVRGDNLLGHSAAIDLAGSWITLERVGAFQGGTYGIYCPGGSYQGIQIRFSLVGYNHKAGFRNNCSDSKAFGSYFFSNFGDGADSFAQKMTWEGDTFEGNSSYGLSVYGGPQHLIVGNHIVDNVGPGLKINAYQKPIADIVLSSNDFRDNGRGGKDEQDCHIWLAGPIRNLTAIGNTFDTGRGRANGYPAPNYVFCGSPSAPPVFTTSAMRDATPRQAAGVYEDGVLRVRIEQIAR